MRQQSAKNRPRKMAAADDAANVHRNQGKQLSQLSGLASLAWWLEYTVLLAASLKEDAGPGTHMRCRRESRCGTSLLYPLFDPFEFCF
jgi:hypothetical protein